MMMIWASIIGLMCCIGGLVYRLNNLAKDSHPDRGEEFKRVVDMMQQRIENLERFNQNFVVRELESMRK